ncbi:MAG: chromosome segregation protein SMC [Pseudomonadota bacterium]
MQFTRLRLSGFKSFVDPTDLVISTGLTGVVGPNGCGKSNLLEALRWIMGENRAKQMRGAGMDDVIFAGTESRPARSSATVELVVDNGERLAPAQFNQDDKLEISRRITREVGSAYRINGKDVRARDVQMLFADASTGAHSPALVRQGQISELINAKPKARRRVLEEAAGISGLYQRRHEAELKLNGTETNLARVDDVLDQLRGRLGALERQAGQARRYRQISEDLRRAHAVLLFLRWHVAETDRAAADAALTESTTTAARAEATARDADRARHEAATALPALREEETVAAAILQRLAIERDQQGEREDRATREIETLAARARQLGMDIEREETLQRDAGGTISRLEGEDAELSGAIDGQADAQAEAAEVARQSGEALSEQETKLDRLTEEAARLAARTAAAERRRDEAVAAHTRLSAEIEQAESALTDLDSRIAEAEATFTRLTEEAEQARTSAQEAETRLSDAETARAAAQETEGETRAALADAEGETGALSAEVQGLERLLARDTKDGAKLIDQITVAPGFEAALGSALGDDLSMEPTDAGTGWHRLTAYDTAQPLPDGATPLSDHVEAPGLLARRLSQIGLTDAAQAEAVQADLLPGQRIVTSDGDLWRWDGLCIRAGDAPTAAALRLQQRNRLRSLASALERAEALKAKARDAQEKARDNLNAANRAEIAARDARRQADTQAAEGSRALNRAEADLGLTKSKRISQADSIEAREAERTAASAAVAEAEATLADLADVTEARRAVDVQRGEVDLARTAMLSARAQADELRRTAISREKRLAEVRRELGIWQDRLENAGTRIAELTKRADETAARQAEIAEVPATLAERREKLDGEIGAAESRRSKAADALAQAENTVRDAETAAREAERVAGERREARARAEAVLEGMVARVTDAAEEIATELDLTPDAILEKLDTTADALPSVDAADADVAKLRRQRDALGAVNLRAEEDAAEVRDELETLSAEKADLDEAIAKLRTGIAELNREGRERLIAAFETVNTRFGTLFQHLFGGGEARLVMVESDDPLDAGLEILCQPPGKKLSTLSLLSGGEQTLTALSLIFAVFLANPAPICVLDEVDAPLDDSNVTRFCDLLDEMCRRTETRFLIITHHAITMSRMDRLFGVTMVERGVSQLVSVDLARATDLVDA